MYLAPEGAEVDVADGAAKLLAANMPIARLHKPDCSDLTDELRICLGDMGWLGLCIAEDAGGSGLSAVEQALFFREVGRQCGPVDIVALCLAAMVAQDGELRQSLIAGRHGVALLSEDGEGYRCLGAASADFALHADRQGATIYSLKDVPSVKCSALDPANSMRNIPGRPANVVTRIAGEHVYKMGQLACAAMLLGIVEATLDLIVAYAKVRETFGRKIGAYQAVRHPCADMALRAEAARAQLWFAAAAMKEGRADADTHLDAAKHLANEAALANADVNIQLHGGIGVTDDHDAHLLLKHALVLSRLFGAKRQLLSRLLHANVEN